MTGPEPAVPPQAITAEAAVAGAIERYCDDLGEPMPSPALAQALAKVALEAAAPHLEAAARERCIQLAELVHASYYAGTDEHGPNLRLFADLLRQLFADLLHQGGEGGGT